MRALKVFSGIVRSICRETKSLDSRVLNLYAIGPILSTASVRSIFPLVLGLGAVLGCPSLVGSESTTRPGLMDRGETRQFHGRSSGHVRKAMYRARVAAFS